MSQWLFPGEPRLAGCPTNYLPPPVPKENQQG